MLMGVICISDITNEKELQVIDAGAASSRQYLVVGEGVVLSEARHQ